MEAIGTEVRLTTLELFTWSAECLEQIRDVLHDEWGFRPSRSQAAAYVFHRFSRSSDPGSYVQETMRSVFGSAGETYKVVLHPELVVRLKSTISGCTHIIPQHVTLVCSAVLVHVARKLTEST